MRKVKQRQKPPPLGITRQESNNDTQRSAAMAVHPPYKQPLVIHTFSPEVIHADAYNFMNLVQRLTGRSSHISPPSKRPRYVPHCMLHTSPGTHHTSVSSEVRFAASSHMPHESDLRRPTLKEQHPASLLEPQQEQQKSISELASRRGLSPRVRSGLKLQTVLSSHSRIGAGIQGGVLVKSPAGCFEFSPSTLPTPPAFLHDFPRLLSPYAHAAGLLSPMVGAVARSPMMMPCMLPSLGPLTSAFLADLPTLSPAAHSWIDRHPLSAELIISPLSRGFRLPPRTPLGHGKSLV